jgi:PAS domain S-box-containing protein
MSTTPRPDAASHPPSRPLVGTAGIVALLAIGAAVLVAGALWLPTTGVKERALGWDAVTVLCSSLAFAATLWAVRIGRAESWDRWLGYAMLTVALSGAAFLIRDSRTISPYRPSAWDIGFLIVAVMFLLPVRPEFKQVVAADDRREIGTDAALGTVAVACLAYLALLVPGASAAQMATAATFGLGASAVIVAYGALTLWSPGPRHVLKFVVIGALGSTVLIVGTHWTHGGFAADQPDLALAFSIGGLVLAAIVTFVPRGPFSAWAGERSHRWGRPLLTTLSVATACVALGAIAIAQFDDRVNSTQALVLIEILAVAVAIRILVNQVRSSRSRSQIAALLEQKQATLEEADLALEQARTANTDLRESEEHLRLVIEAAVDGILELDEADVILRANEAFCRMVDLPRDRVEGRTWAAVAADVEGADESFATLPVTGQGLLSREGQPIYFEARPSKIPSHPPKRLLLVRDTTNTRVNDQTIRSLLQFLQERDFDRASVLRRTNSAIEAERNRIARDLHDGPVQGVSAASLSLEAALLMVKAGDLESGIDVLTKVREELSEEADNLRRLMSGLRPPLLEERGLVPAIRETLAKFGDEHAVATEFSGRVRVEIPADIETLAYRIVQEALANAGKHANAAGVTVTIESDTGQIRLEIVDDGQGFDSGRTRDYLREGRVGLASMRERVELVNGTFTVHSTPGRGTTIFAMLPLDPTLVSHEPAD